MTTQITTTTAPYLAEIERDPALQSEKTRARYGVVLDKFYAWKGDRQINKTTIEEYCSELQALHRSPATIRQILAVLKWWTRRVIDLAYENRPQAEADNIAAQLTRILTIREKSVAKGTRLPAGRHVRPEELAALVAACTNDPTPAGARDACWLTIAIQTGARNEELRQITLKNLKYTPEGADLTIPHGKGDKARIVFLSGNVLAALDAWINVRGATPGALFCPVLKNGRVLVRELSAAAADLILEKRFKQSGIRETISWHDFRRTLAGNLFSSNVDPVTIKDQLGHANITTTQRYDRRPDELRRIAIANIEVPYKNQ
jgi:integrase